VRLRGGAVILTASIAAVVGATACRAPAPASSPAGAWALVEPPEIADAQAPGGIRLLPKEAIERWKSAGRYETESACDAARNARITDTISTARHRLGLDARFDLDVRRAVNACCVPAGASGESLLTCRRDGAPITPP
jgi:hypothetical protein